MLNLFLLLDYFQQCGCVLVVRCIEIQAIHMATENNHWFLLGYCESHRRVLFYHVLGNSVIFPCCFVLTSLFWYLSSTSRYLSSQFLLFLRWKRQMLTEKDLVLARNGMVAQEVLGVDHMVVAHVAHPVDWTMLEGLTIVSLFCLFIYFWIFMCSFFNPLLNTILISLTSRFLACLWLLLWLKCWGTSSSFAVGNIL